MTIRQIMPLSGVAFALLCVLDAVPAAPEKDSGRESPADSAGKMIGSIRAKKEEALKLEAASHEALDKEEYERAVEFHRRARSLLAEAEQMKKKLDVAVDLAVGKYLSELGHDEFKAREKATTALLQFGPRILPQLRDAIKTVEDPEVADRLRHIVKTIGNVRIDSDGRFRQWAQEATASSQYGNPSWSAGQATGEPNTPRAGDFQTAWAPGRADGGVEWLQLTFGHPTVATQIRVRETYNPGAVTKIEIRDEAGKWHRYWEGKDGTKTAPAWFEPKAKAAKLLTIPTREVRITLDTRSVGGYNEIDAVELIGNQ